MTHSRQTFLLALVISPCLLLALLKTFRYATAANAWAANQGAGTLSFYIYLPGVLRAPSPPDLTRMVQIPGGVFQMGCGLNLTESCFLPDETPLHSVHLETYYIDRFEVSIADYETCVDEGSCSAPTNFSSATRAFYYGNPTYANYPVIFVTWRDADNYCRWNGKRLPTEAEWEKAGRGTEGARRHPWGDDLPSCLLTNFHYWIGITNNQFCVGDTTPVGNYPSGASPYGVMDMSGNVREWVQDWYQFDYYETSPSINPSGPAIGEQKLTKGGGWFDIWTEVRIARRSPLVPEATASYLGFRCAYSEVK